MAEGIALSVAFISTFVLTIWLSLLRRTEIFTSTISHWLLTWHLPTCRWELWVYYIHLPCRLRIPASLIGTEKTNKPLYIFFWSLILFFSQASLISEPSYSLRDFTPYIGQWSTEHYQQSIQNRCFYSLDTRSPYLCDQDCIKSLSFLQTHHVHLGAIYFDSSVNHVWL